MRGTTVLDRLRRDDRGVALIMVTLTMMVLTVVVTGALWFATQTQTSSRHDQDWNAALAAAQSGVDDYLARLNKVDVYWTTKAENTAYNADCANVAMQTVPLCASKTTALNGSFKKVGWRQVPGSATASFHYDIDASQTYNSGAVKLTSTGRVNGVTRSVQTTLRKDGFGDFLYYTEFETSDPVYNNDPTSAQTYCSRHFWDNPARGSDSGTVINKTFTCNQINFIGGDVIRGPLHSNDAIQVAQSSNGSVPDFEGPVTTSLPTCQNAAANKKYLCYVIGGAAATSSDFTPTFAQGVSYRGRLPFPATIGSLKQYTDPTLTANPGCLYTGPTRIKFLSGAQAGKMKVWSRFSTSLRSGCGNPSAQWPQIVNVPQNTVIYVQAIPSGTTGINSSLLTSTKSCAPKVIDDGPSSDTDSDTIPISGDAGNTLNEANCGYGTLYVSGELTGRVTATAENNIVVVDDLTYAGDKGGTDSLGLIATNAIQVFHPVTSFASTGDNNIQRPAGLTNNHTASYYTDVTIQAAMLSVQHTFTVQAYGNGAALGTLNVFGTIAQLYRGPVGTSSNSVKQTGYTKAYAWDSRLKYAPPPFFLDPVGSSWSQKTFGELKRAY